jgi:hypothetical protein
MVWDLGLRVLDLCFRIGFSSLGSKDLGFRVKGS